MKKLSFLLLIFYILGIQSISSETIVLKGKQVATYRVTHPKKIVPVPHYISPTFRQEITKLKEKEMIIKITVNLDSLSTQVNFPINYHWPEGLKVYLNSTQKVKANNAQIKSIATNLVKNSKYLDEAVANILSWVRDNIEYDFPLQLPVDSISVLANKKARCEGYTNLSLALLRAAGIPCRAVTNYTPPGSPWGIAPGKGGLHSSLEVYYPDLGWILYDAQGSLHFVDAYHIYLFSEIDDEGSHFVYQGTSPENMKLIKGNKNYKRLGDFFQNRNTQIEILNFKDTFLMVDKLFSPQHQIKSAQVRNEIKGATILGTVKNEKGEYLSTVKNEGWVFIWKENKGIGYTVDENGFYSIAGLKSGEYIISTKAKGYAHSPKIKISAIKGKIVRYDFILNKGINIYGLVVFANNIPAKDCVVRLTKEKSTSFIPHPVKSDGTFLIEDVKAGEYYLLIVDKKNRLILDKRRISLTPSHNQVEIKVILNKDKIFK